MNMNMNMGMGMGMVMVMDLDICRLVIGKGRRTDMVMEW
jgi:hypothetical protein